MMKSSLVNYTKISPFKNSPRNHSVDTITIHHVVGKWTMKRGGDFFQSSNNSCNYNVCQDGIALIVDENDRSWCSSSSSNDNRAITIEVCDDPKTFVVDEHVYNKLIDLCVDICKRYNKKRMVWNANKTETLKYNLGSDVMYMTIHKWFSATACPGSWLENKMSEIAEKVNERLGGCEDMGCPYWLNGKCTKGEVSQTIDANDVVSITGNTYYTGSNIPKWVKNKQWIVHSVNGDRVVINKSTDGKNSIMSPIHVNNLKLIKKG